jgi:hypothetical protein
MQGRGAYICANSEQSVHSPMRPDSNITLLSSACEATINRSAAPCPVCGVLSLSLEPDKSAIAGDGQPGNKSRPQEHSSPRSQWLNAGNPPTPPSDETRSIRGLRPCQNRSPCPEKNSSNLRRKECHHVTRYQRRVDPWSVLRPGSLP